jgi:hypothetical protein
MAAPENVSRSKQVISQNTGVPTGDAHLSALWLLYQPSTPLLAHCLVLAKSTVAGRALQGDTRQARSDLHHDNCS